MNNQIFEITSTVTVRVSNVDFESATDKFKTMMFQNFGMVKFENTFIKVVDKEKEEDSGANN